MHGRRAPAPSLQVDGSADQGLAMRLGLLPDCPAGAGDTDVADGLEPILGLSAAGDVYWTTHFGWFRWFASGDVALLGLLLFLRELA